MTQQAALTDLTAGGFEPAEPPAQAAGDTLTCKSRLAAFQRRAVYLARRTEWDADELHDLLDEAVDAGCLDRSAADSLRADIDAGEPDDDSVSVLLTRASELYHA